MSPLGHPRVACDRFASSGKRPTSATRWPESDQAVLAHPNRSRRHVLSRWLTAGAGVVAPAAHLGLPGASGLVALRSGRETAGIPTND